MASSRRTVYLIAFTYSSTQRRHFGLLIPKLENGEESNTDGTLIHAVGAPMTGFNLEFKRSYNHETSRTRHELYNLGTVPVSVINQLTEQPHQRMQRLQPAPQTILEVLAFIVPLPQRAPVNEPVNNVSIAESSTRWFKLCKCPQECMLIQLCRRLLIVDVKNGLQILSR